MNGCGCNHGAGVVLGPCVPKSCAKVNNNLRIKTVVLPASAGTDEAGQAYAPKLGAYTNSIVKYMANGAIYIYDSRGIFTQIQASSLDVLQDTVTSLQESMNELYQPKKTETEVQTYEDLQQIDPATLPNGAMVYVATDETHEGEQSLYFWNPAAEAWSYAGAASPYLRREAVKSMIDELNNAITLTAQMLQTNINAEVNARESDRDNLQTNINKEVEAREAADNNLQTQIDATVASTDVKDVVGTKAELEAYDTTTLGDNDIIKVLSDESEEDAITYYRWSTETKTFTLIGETGPYYTKAEVDEAIKSSTPSISYENSYSTSTVKANSAYFINSKLNDTNITLGKSALASATSGGPVCIGWNSKTNSASDAIGGYAEATGQYSVALGPVSEASGDYSVAVGNGAVASTSGSVAIGWRSSVTREREFSVGGGMININRVISHVAAGTEDTDAVNLKQMNDAIAVAGGDGSSTLMGQLYLPGSGARTDTISNLTAGKNYIGLTFKYYASATTTTEFTEYITITYDTTSYSLSVHCPALQANNPTARTNIYVPFYIPNLTGSTVTISRNMNNTQDNLSTTPDVDYIVIKG